MAEEHQATIINRLKSIEGHVRGIQRMVSEDAYCIDIINQVLAVQR
ncbi:MAG TPA: metal-sensitive transcriptional regulator, partial [Anaerolineae bacterium]|nr:metal-sensitive transcriptional regulator [Anaerolineae bacterium]